MTRSSSSSPSKENLPPFPGDMPYRAPNEHGAVGEAKLWSPILLANGCLSVNVAVIKWIND
jgi:hypothetical protein